MADATNTAKARVDRALAALERKVADLKARPASAPAIADDDLFAPETAGSGSADLVSQQRIAVLEASGRDASAVLALAADRIRFILADTAQDDAASDTDAG